MKTFSLSVLAAMVAVLFVISITVAAPPEIKLSGPHYNLNIIGFSKCTKTTTDPDCFKGNAGDIETSGHTIFVPLKTAQAVDICLDGSTAPDPGDDVDAWVAWLEKGVRILVSDAGGTDIKVIDRDATDGTARFNLPDGCYEIFARAGGKPGGCMDIDTIICYDFVEVTPGVFDYVQVDCSPSLDNDRYVLVGHLDIDRIKGVKPSWQNATGNLLPVETGVGSGEPGYFDFFWQIFNDNLRLLQLRIYKVACPQ